MKKAFWLAGFVGVVASAQMAPIDPQYQKWMQSMQPSLAAVRAASNTTATGDAANQLADTFNQVAGYWRAKQTADAVGFAETARDAAKAIAAGGDKTANLAKIQEQCGACHTAHRFPKGGDSDPDRAIGAGTLPPGWNVRPDRGPPNQDNLQISGDVYHFTMGPAGTFYRSDWTKSGDYQFSARLTQLKAPSHPISYGLMIGGSDLAGAEQTYSYFLVRNQGEFYVANREGDKKPVTVVDWTANPAIVKQGANGKQTNKLAIQIQGDNVIFSVNGVEVTRLPKSKVHADGQYGFRIGHNLDVDLDQLTR